MATPVPLRSDLDAEALRVLAKSSRDRDQTRYFLRRVDEVSER